MLELSEVVCKISRTVVCRLTPPDLPPKSVAPRVPRQRHAFGKAHAAFPPFFFLTPATVALRRRISPSLHLRGNCTCHSVRRAHTQRIANLNSGVATRVPLAPTQALSALSHSPLEARALSRAPPHVPRSPTTLRLTTESHAGGAPNRLDVAQPIPNQP